MQFVRSILLRAAALAAAAILIGGCGPGQSRLSRLTMARGEIYVIRAGSAGPVLVKAGEILQHGDTIRTGPGAAAEVMVQNVGMFRVSENSELKMEELQDKNKTIIRLDKGKAGFFLLKQTQDQETQVTLPTAVAGVRGTKFLASAVGGSKVALFDGAVQVADPAKQTMLLDKPGEVKLKEGESLKGRTPQPLSAESISDMKSLEQMFPINLEQPPRNLEEVRPEVPAGGDLPQPGK